MKEFILSFFLGLFAYCLLPTADCYSQNSDKLVLMETSYGNIKLKLYNETPLHRDNFLKLISNKMFDSLLFHRVINNFMIQGGIPDSNTPASEKNRGKEMLEYTIPPEFNSKLFHKRGVLAAGREGDEINPEQASSCCQFYIVQGKIFNDSTLGVAAKRVTRMKAYNNVIKNKENKTLFEKYNLYVKNENIDSIKVAKARIDKLTDAEVLNIIPYKFSDEQQVVYKKTGGAPHLDGSYTVFGEVTEGMEVVDKIASAPRDKADRPLSDVKMKISIIK